MISILHLCTLFLLHQPLTLFLCLPLFLSHTTLSFFPTFLPIFPLSSLPQQFLSPPPRLKDGQPINLDGKHYKQVEGPDGTVCLQIDAATEGDAGEISCVAKNPEGDSTSKATLSVLGERLKGIIFSGQISKLVVLLLFFSKSAEEGSNEH